MSKSIKLPEDILSPDAEKELTLAAQRKVEGLAFQIKDEIARLATLSNEIATMYSEYAESDLPIDSESAIHAGLGNMLKLIEVQNAVKLRVKRMQVMILKIIADNSPNDELPFAISDALREVNVGFLDSKLVRAYGEISKVMKEDSDRAKSDNRVVEFVTNGKLAVDSDYLEGVEDEDEGEDGDY